MTVKMLLKIGWLVLAVMNYVGYRKSNNLRDYISYWGCMIIAVLH